MHGSRAAILAALAITVSACSRSITSRLRPPITHDERGARAQAIRSASDIIVAQITQFEIIGDPKILKHVSAAGPSDFPDIPLYPTRMTTQIQVTLRGSLPNRVEFYSWIWKSGSHGGGRLFDPSPDVFHVLFLTRANGHLQTVGDYPAYDLLIVPSDIPNVLTELQKAKETDLFERLARAMLTVEYQKLKNLPRGYTPYDMVELAG